MNYISAAEKRYQAVPDDDTTDETSSHFSISGGNIESRVERLARYRTWTFIILTLLNIVLFFSSLLLFSDTSGLLWGTERSNGAWRRANEYSPIIDDIPIPLNTQKMKGTFIDYDHDIYRQLPSPAVDKAWDKLTEHGFTHVSENQALKMGWDISTTAKFPTSFGLGSETYYAGETDMIHKMHCLNMVRKDVFFKYYWGEMYPGGEPSERHKIHTSHCLYIILQSLMCDAHTDLIPHVYLEDYVWAVPDFQINRKCGNFEGVLHWEETHSVTFNETTTKMLEKPAGQKARPMTAEFRRVFEVNT